MSRASRIFIVLCAAYVASQFYRVANAVIAPELMADLALSAGVPQTICRSMCTRLEELGVVEPDEERRWRVSVSHATLARRSRDLVRRLETQRREDELRLETLHAYANTTDCRSVFLRVYFGEESPPECGNCDNCLPSAASAAPGRSSKRRP